MGIFEFKSIWFLLVVFEIIYDSSVFAYSDSLVINSTSEYANYTAISDFRVVNRRVLYSCLSINPFITLTVTPDNNLPNDGFVTVTINGIMHASKLDWVGMVTASHSDGEYCPFNKLMYAQTGDLEKMPLLCHYPIKAQYLRNDPNYLKCKWSFFRPKCSATLTFHVVNIRTDIEFILFGMGFNAPCVLRKSAPLRFASPKMPLYGHLSSVDSSAASMKLTWVSGDNAPQSVQLRDANQTVPSQVATFTQNDMCTSALKSPAKDFGWHDPGFIHSAVMTGLKPMTTYSYRYGSDSAGWSDYIQFRTPPASGADALRFISFGDFGKTPRDSSSEHFIQPGAGHVSQALTDEVASGNYDSIFHIGDISYATGFLVEWDYFLHQITPYASKISYMTAIGNHERDFVGKGAVYITPDSGGECGVPYETYFPMPTAGKDKPWYSIEQGPVHFTVISSEHEYKDSSEQYKWIVADLASVNRTRTPWVIFMSHRPLYCTVRSLVLTVKDNFGYYIEPLLYKYQVDLVLVAHVHNYERTCAIYQGQCKSVPVTDPDGTITYNSANYTAPVHALIGMAGFSLDRFPSKNHPWSLSRHAEFGYVRYNVTRKELISEFVQTPSKKVLDRFRIVK